MDIYIKSSRKPPRRPPAKIAGIMSVLCLVLGLALIFQAAWPVVGWYLFVMPAFSEKIISPLASTFPPLVRAAENESYQPAAWFKDAQKILGTPTDLKTYSLTIPKLKIDKADVEIGGDLKKTLVAWPTSALPGSYGNNIIFGHSELPQFANPKNYSGIFTFLMDLETGDDIFVDYGNVRYHYSVMEKKVVEAEDIAVLEQRFDAAYLTMITCVPPGTLWKRGIIRARLSPL